MDEKKIDEREKLKTTENEETKKTGGRSVLYLLALGAIWFLSMALYKHLFHMTVIPSESMEPTLQVGDITFNDVLHRKDIKRGDIIEFTLGEKKHYVKRVIGLPGDTITFVDGVTYINGEPYDEPYIKEKNEVVCDAVFVVPENEYFVMGDNRNNSNDSRYWEYPYVKQDNIIAKVKMILIPFKHAGGL